MSSNARLSGTAVLAFATVLGLLIAVSDVAAPFGDDSAQFTVFLWLLSSGVLGFTRPGGAWRWALSIGPWLPLTHLVVSMMGRVDHPIVRDTYATILLLLPVSVAVCLVGAYGGALARRLFLPRFPSIGAGAH